MTAKSRANTKELFWVSVDDWYRDYLFGINDRKIFDSGPYFEHDCIRIAGRIKSKTKRNYNSIEVHLHPIRDPDRYLRIASENIGDVWAKKGRLFCSAFIPADAYHSLPVSLAANQFAEFLIEVNNLWRGKGSVARFEFERDPTDLNEDVNPNMLAESVRVRHFSEN